MSLSPKQFGVAASAAVVAILAIALVNSQCGSRTTTTTTEQHVEKKVDDTVNHQASTDTHSGTATTTSKQRHEDESKDIDLKKKVVKRKTTVQKPDGTVISNETETTTFEKQDKTKSHKDDGETSTAQSETTQHTQEQTQSEHHEATRTDTKTTTTTTVGSQSAFRIGFYLNQDLRDIFVGKLSLTPGVSAGLKLVGPTSVSAGIDLAGDVWVGGNVSYLGLYLHQDVTTFKDGFHPKPGISLDVHLFGPLGVSAGIDTSLQGYVGIAVRAF